MVITSEEEYAAALERLEQMFGKVEDADDEREFETLINALEAWEAKMGTHCDGTGLPGLTLSPHFLSSCVMGAAMIT